MRSKCQNHQVATCTRASVQRAILHFWLVQAGSVCLFCPLMWFSTYMHHFSWVKWLILWKMCSSAFFCQIFSFDAHFPSKWYPIQISRVPWWCTGYGLCLVSVLVNSEKVATCTRASVQRLKMWNFQKLSFAGFRAWS